MATTCTLAQLAAVTRHSDNFPGRVSQRDCEAIVSIAVRTRLGLAALGRPFKLDLMNGHTMHIRVTKSATWHSGRPPKRGAYWTRSDPATAKSPNACWRYWFGDHWGPACRSRKGAQHAGKPGVKHRRVALRHAVQWRASKEG